jgi:hypothetical protein
MPGSSDPLGVAYGGRRAQGLSYQGNGTLATIWGTNVQADPRQSGSGGPGAAVEHLPVYVDHGAVLAGHAPADGLGGLATPTVPLRQGACGRKASEILGGGPTTAVRPGWFMYLRQARYDRSGRRIAASMRTICA